MLKSKKNVATRKGYVVTNLRKSKSGRNYAVVFRPKVKDFVVANGYNTKDGTWAQGYYGFKSRKSAVKVAEKNARKFF